MRAIVKVFVVGTLGLAVVFGSPAPSFARPVKTLNLCVCKCSYVASPQDVGSGTTAALTAGSCDSIPLQAADCLDSNGKSWKGSITGGSCKFKQKVTIPMSHGTLQPTTPVPPGAVKPSVTPGQMQR